MNTEGGGSLDPQIPSDIENEGEGRHALPISVEMERGRAATVRPVFKLYIESLIQGEVPGEARPVLKI